MRSTSRPRPLSEEASRITAGDAEKIAEDVRQHAAAQGLSEEAALQKGMEEKSAEFTEKGAEVYLQA